MLNFEVTLTIERLGNQDLSETWLKMLLRNDIDGLKSIRRKNELLALKFEKSSQN